METILRFAKMNPNSKVVIVELWGEQDGTPKHLRRTTLRPTEQTEKFRQDVPSEDMESFKKAIQEEIEALDDYIELRRRLSKMLDFMEGTEEPNASRLAYTAKLFCHKK